MNNNQSRGNDIKAWKGANPSRLRGGLSQHLIRGLDSMNQTELQDLYKNTDTMLNSSNFKLPDGGAKLKAKLVQIDQLLSTKFNNSDIITKGVADLSLDKEMEEGETVTISATENNSTNSSNIMRAHSKEEQSQRQQQVHGTRMMSLDESIQLQESQQNDIKQANMRKRLESVQKAFRGQGLADDVSTTLEGLKLDPGTRVPRPDDDGPSDGEGRDVDSDDDFTSDEEYNNEEDDILGYEDEGYEEEEDEELEFEDGQTHNNNNQIM